MTRDEVLAMAEQAGFLTQIDINDGVEIVNAWGGELETRRLERFAALAFEAGRKAAEQDRVDAERYAADCAEIQYWRDRHADIMHRRDHANNRTLSEIIFYIRQCAIDRARSAK